MKFLNTLLLLSTIKTTMAQNVYNLGQGTPSDISGDLTALTYYQVAGNPFSGDEAACQDFCDPTTCPDFLAYTHDPAGGSPTCTCWLGYSGDIVSVNGNALTVTSGDTFCFGCKDAYHMGEGSPMDGAGGSFTKIDKTGADAASRSICEITCGRYNNLVGYSINVGVACTCWIGDGTNEIASVDDTSNTCGSSGTSNCGTTYCLNCNQVPSSQPSGVPSGQPSGQPSGEPSGQPSGLPSGQPSGSPSGQPSSKPSESPSGQPSGSPSEQPSGIPSESPSGQPSSIPSEQPSGSPSGQPSTEPSEAPSGVPSGSPSGQPSTEPSEAPSGVPSESPSGQPSSKPSEAPSGVPSESPSGQPSSKPSESPSGEPSESPSGQPSSKPSESPSGQPSESPSEYPSSKPSEAPSGQPSEPPSEYPSSKPSEMPSGQPSSTPSELPSAQPSEMPSTQPSGSPSGQPSSQPSGQPTSQPSESPSAVPSCTPSMSPTDPEEMFLFYPDWSPEGQVCKNDGNEPNYMRASPSWYLYSTLDRCCSTHFSWNYDNCMGYLPGTCARALFYPNWAQDGNDVCIDDGNQPPYMTDNHMWYLYSQVTDCCAAHFQYNYAACVGNSKSTINSRYYYVDWEGGDKGCQTGGGQPAYMNNAPELWMHDTIEDCCRFNYNWKYDDCVGFSPATAPVSSLGYYADWQSNKHVCANDGNQPAYMKKSPSSWMFSNLEDCCDQNFKWNFNECMGSPSSSASATATATTTAIATTSPANGKYYMSWTAQRCVQDCYGVSPCGGNANPWDILYASLKVCCEERNWWNNDCYP